MPLCLKVILYGGTALILLSTFGLGAYLAVRRFIIANGAKPLGAKECYVCRRDVSNPQLVGRSFTDMERIVYLCKRCAAFDDQFADQY